VQPPHPYDENVLLCAAHTDKMSSFGMNTRLTLVDDVRLVHTWRPAMKAIPVQKSEKKMTVVVQSLALDNNAVHELRTSINSTCNPLCNDITCPSLSHWILQRVRGV